MRSKENDFRINDKYRKILKQILVDLENFFTSKCLYREKILIEERLDHPDRRGSIR